VVRAQTAGGRLATVRDPKIFIHSARWPSGPRSRGSAETDAGVAEAVICVALLWGAGSLARRGAAGYRAALWTTVFAIAGFCLGLSITVPSGYVPDIADHATVLPILVITCTLIVRSARPGDGAGQAPRQDRQALQR
jgi:hypothetical protein